MVIAVTSCGINSLRVPVGVGAGTVCSGAIGIVIVLSKVVALHEVNKAILTVKQIIEERFITA